MEIIFIDVSYQIILSHWFPHINLVDAWIQWHIRMPQLTTRLKSMPFTKFQEKEDFAVYSDHIFYSFILSFIIRAQFFICKLQFLLYFRNLSSIVYTVICSFYTLFNQRKRSRVKVALWLDWAYSLPCWISFIRLFSCINLLSCFSSHRCCFVKTQFLQLIEETITITTRHFIWAVTGTREWTICYFFLVLQ